MDYQALKTELDATHPVTGAYDADDVIAAGQINAENITRIKARMSGREIFENTNAAEYAALTDAKKSEWISFCGIDEHDPKSGGPAQEFVTYVFGGGSTTVSNLNTARDESISRATELGFGTVLVGDVQYARSLA